MGEGIDIYYSGKLPRKKTERKYSALSAQVVSLREKTRSDANKAMRPLIGTKVKVKGKRKEIEVEIDRDTIKHISNDTALGRLPIKPTDLKNLHNWIANGVQVKVSGVDAFGRHSGNPKQRVKDFRYFRFEHEGQILYANVESIHINLRGKVVQKYRLHTITKKLKE